MYLGDIRPGAILDTSFPTTAPTTGVPTTLAGTPVISIYKDNSTTESTTGVTLTVDFDGRTGYNHLRIDTSADPTTFTRGSNFRAVITTGTVGGVSAVGLVVAEFSVHARGAHRLLVIQETRKYGVALGTAPNNKIRLLPAVAGGGGFATSADYTPVVADWQVSVNNAAEANISSVPAWNDGALELNLTAAELQGRLITIRGSDAAPKAIDDIQIVIYTYGDANAMSIDDVSVASTATPANFSALAIDSSGRVVLTPTANTAVVAAIDSGSTQLAALITAAASLTTAVTNLNNLSALCNLFGPSVMEVPAVTTRVYPLILTVRDSEGHLIDLDAAPTLAIVNAIGTDRSANLSGVTHASTGVYTFTYSVAAAAAEEGLRLSATGAVASSARRADLALSIVSVDTTTTLASILAKVTNLPADPTSETNATTHATAVLTRLGAPAGASVSADIAAVETSVGASSAPSATTIADAVLVRNLKGGANGPASQSVSAALASGLMQFTVDVPTSTLTVKYPDGSTAYTRTLARAQLDAIIAAV